MRPLKIVINKSIDYMALLPSGLKQSQGLPYKLEAISLSTRTYNVLKRRGISTIGELIEKWDQIPYFLQIGEISLIEIAQKLTIWYIENKEIIQNTSSTPKEVFKEIIQIQSSTRQDKDKNTDRKPKNLCYLLYVLELIQDIDRNTGIKPQNPSLSQQSEDKNTAIKPQSLCYFFYVLEFIRDTYKISSKSERIIPIMSSKEGINTLFGVLRKKERNVLEARYGLCGKQKLTLQEVGDLFGVTRERIRQIERKALHKLSPNLKIMAPFALFEVMKERIRQRGGVISSGRLAEELQGELLDSGYDAGGLLELFQDKENLNISKSCPPLIYVEDLNAWSLKTYDQEQITLASNRIRKILSGATHPMQWVELYSILCSSDGLLTLDEDLALNIALCLSEGEQINYNLSGSWTIQAENDTNYQRIVTTLRQIGSPAHFSEIAALYNELYPDRPLSEHNVHSNLGRNEFVRVGRGTFGLAEWGLNDDGNISNAVRRVLITQNRPMSIAEISEEVLRTWQVSKFSIAAAIDTDARFSKTEDRLIWLTEIGLAVEKRRIRDDETRQDRVIFVLQEINQPASAQEIINKHNKLYPNSPLTLAAIKNMLYRQDRIFVRLEMDKFGLTKWGLQSLPLQPTKKTSTRFQEILIVLEQTGKPVHYGELARLHNQAHPERPISANYTAQILMRLKQDKGIVVDYGEGIYGLKFWDKQRVP